MAKQVRMTKPAAQSERRVFPSSRPVVIRLAPFRRKPLTLALTGCCNIRADCALPVGTILGNGRSYCRANQAGVGRRLRPAFSALLIQREADAQRHLVVAHGTVLDMAARLHHLEPFHLANGLGGTADCVLDRILDRGLGRSDQFQDLVDVIRLACGHDYSPLVLWRGRGCFLRATSRRPATRPPPPPRPAPRGPSPPGNPPAAPPRGG